MLSAERFDVKKSPKSLDYIIKRDVGTIRCNKCGSPVLKSDLNDYAYQCMNCDEDLYAIETHEGAYHTEEEFETLCCDVRDLLLLDD